MKLFHLLSLAAMVVSGIRAADAPPEPGHSMHGEAFNEGPRQAAVLLGGTGDVHFSVTTKSEMAQRFFDQGVGQIHGFWYFEAERSFRQVAALDADCAMAYWGMAMANVNNPKRAADFIKQATRRRDRASHREQLWIDSLAAYLTEKKTDEKQRREELVRALEELSFEFPDDIEAKAFLVLQHYDNKGHGIPITARKAVDALAREVLAANPMHPGIHHYRIHLWNNGDGDKHALDSAALCGQSAPSIAHLWHMSGHTFSNLKRYTDAAWQQEASARVDHAYMIGAHILPDQIHNFAHNNDWLVKNLGYVGRVHDGIELAKNMIELPRLPSRDSSSYALGRERLVDLLVKFELWSDLTALEGTMYLAPNENPVAEVNRLRALGVAYFNGGDRARAEEKLTALETSLRKAREERVAAADAAEQKAKADKKSGDEIDRQMLAALRRFAPRIDLTEGAIAELRMYRALADSKIEEAKGEFGKTRDISVDRQARLWLELGDKDKAGKLAREAIGKDDQQVQPVANLAWILWQLGKKDEARKIFGKLRDISARIDLDLPAFTRLAPIASDLGLSADWRAPQRVAADTGTRPSLDALGPFRWHPYEAPDWTLPDAEGKAHALADFAGKPVLVLFYLGHGCIRCVEQLNLFAPMAKDFAAAGISMVAVSTDSADALHETAAQSKDTAGFPFPILADEGLAAFKHYRAFDDFEHIPLHGAFLIDGAGRVRWQDISFQPFRDPKWLLGECKRLLSFPATPTAHTAAAK